MRPVSVFAKGPAGEIEQLQVGLHGRRREAARAVVLLPLHLLPHCRTVQRAGLTPAVKEDDWLLAHAQGPRASMRARSYHASPGPAKASALCISLWMIWVNTLVNSHIAVD
jgi:hypothetical protein